MKTRIATLMVLMGIFIASTAFANQPVTATAAVKSSVKQILKKELSYPDFAIKNKLECDVVVSIVIQDDGTFKVNCANCQCPKMKNEVIADIEKLGNKKFAKFAGQEINLKLKYELIS